MVKTCRVCEKIDSPYSKVETCLPLFEDIDQRLSAAVDISSLLKKWYCSLRATSAAKAGLILWHLRRGLKPRPFKTKSKPEFFRSGLKPRPFKTKPKLEFFSKLLKPRPFKTKSKLEFFQQTVRASRVCWQLRLFALRVLRRDPAFGRDRLWPFRMRLGRFGPACVRLQSGKVPP